MDQEERITRLETLVETQRTDTARLFTAITELRVSIDDLREQTGQSMTRLQDQMVQANNKLQDQMVQASNKLQDQMVQVNDKLQQQMIQLHFSQRDHTDQSITSLREHMDRSFQLLQKENIANLRWHIGVMLALASLIAGLYVKLFN